MAAEDNELLQGHELVKLQVASGTQLSTRAADVVKNLSKDTPAVVSLSTKCRNANKLISIVEIAKRELKSKDIKVFQYNALSSETIEVERKPSNGGYAVGNAAEHDSDDAFETMGAKSVEGSKRRVLPVMTTYLSVTPVEELRRRHG